MDARRSDGAVVLGAVSFAGAVVSPLGTVLDVEGVGFDVEGVVEVEGVVDPELGCCTVLGLVGLTVGDCVGVVGAGPAGAADPAEPAEPPDEDDCACACSFRSADAAAPNTSNSVRPIHSKLLIGIAVSFASNFLLSPMDAQDSVRNHLRD